jgi:hypothetical protein
MAKLFVQVRVSVEVRSFGGGPTLTRYVVGSVNP